MESRNDEEKVTVTNAKMTFSVLGTDLFLTEFLEDRVMFLGGSRVAGGDDGAGAGVAGAEVRGSRPPAAATPASIINNNHPVITVRYSR